MHGVLLEWIEVYLKIDDDIVYISDEVLSWPLSACFVFRRV